MDDGIPARSRAASILILVAIFMMGLVSGAALFYLGQRSVPPPAGWGPRHSGGPGGSVRRLVDDLELDDRQRRQVEEIVHRSRSRVHEILESSRAEIREVLTPEQREAFERMRGLLAPAGEAAGEECIVPMIPRLPSSARRR